MVTAEVAVALPALILVMALSIWGVVAASTQIACTDAARSGARAAARGEPISMVRARVARSLPAGASVRVQRDSQRTRVEIAAPVEAPASANLPPLVIRVHATAVTEPGADDQSHAANGSRGAVGEGPG
jgi:Flp pilus assembly protein TadG